MDLRIDITHRNRCAAGLNAGLVNGSWRWWRWRTTGPGAGAGERQVQKLT